MKITKSQLKQIIKEELSAILQEGSLSRHIQHGRLRAAHDATAKRTAKYFGWDKKKPSPEAEAIKAKLAAPVIANREQSEATNLDLDTACDIRASIRAIDYHAQREDVSGMLERDFPSVVAREPGLLDVEYGEQAKYHRERLERIKEGLDEYTKALIDAWMDSGGQVKNNAYHELVRKHLTWAQPGKCF